LGIESGVNADSFEKLRIANPAPDNNSNAMAISITTKDPRRKTRLPPVPVRSDPCLREFDNSSRDKRARLVPDRTATLWLRPLANVNRKTRVSSCMDSARGSGILFGSSTSNPLRPNIQYLTPAAHPASDKSKSQIKVAAGFFLFCTQRDAHANLMQTARRSHQQKIGDIGARDQQNEGNRPQQHQ